MPKSLTNLKFDFEKFISCLTYFARHCPAHPDLTKLKLAKLFYFLDKYHLLNYGRPIIGDNYIRLGLGPVPSIVDNILDEIEGIQIVRSKLSSNNKAIFDKFLKLVKDSKYPSYKAKVEPELDVLSKSEIEALEVTVKKFGKYAASTLVDITHREPIVENTPLNAYMEYRKYFDFEKHAKPEAVKYFESIEEDNLFLHAIDV